MQKLPVKCECEHKDISVFWQVIIILAVITILVWAGVTGYASIIH